MSDAARSSPAQRRSIAANSMATVKEAEDALGAKSIFRYLSNICGVVRNSLRILMSLIEIDLICACPTAHASRTEHFFLIFVVRRLSPLRCQV